MITTLVSALATALVAALWDVGRRFATRPLQSREADLDKALQRLDDAELKILEHARIITGHSDKLTNKSLQHVQLPDAPPRGGRTPKFR